MCVICVRNSTKVLKASLCLPASPLFMIATHNLVALFIFFLSELLAQHCGILQPVLIVITTIVWLPQ